MKKPLIALSSSKFAKLLDKLKEVESAKGKLKVGKTSLSNFVHLHANVINDGNDPKDIRTKRRILFIAGNYNRDPATLKPSTNLKVNLHFNSDQYTQLQIRLDKLVKEYLGTASILSTEANKCETVGDCVALVNKKTTIPV